MKDWYPTDDIAERLMVEAKRYAIEDIRRPLLEMGAQEIIRLREKIAGYAGFVPGDSKGDWWKGRKG